MITVPCSMRWITPWTISSFALGELVEDHLPLGVAQLLHDDLLGGLRGDAAEKLGGVTSRSSMSPDRAFGLDLAGRGEGDLVRPFRLTSTTVRWWKIRTSEVA